MLPCRASALASASSSARAASSLTASSSSESVRMELVPGRLSPELSCGVLAATSSEQARRKVKRLRVVQMCLGGVCVCGGHSLVSRGFKGGQVGCQRSCSTSNSCSPHRSAWRHHHRNSCENNGDQHHEAYALRKEPGVVGVAGRPMRRHRCASKLLRTQITGLKPLYSRARLRVTPAVDRQSEEEGCGKCMPTSRGWSVVEAKVSGFRCSATHRSSVSLPRKTVLVKTDVCSDLKPLRTCERQ